ncbi:MAG: hypothetical protein AAGB93_13435 [Planctomycetota bacterium]
MDRADSPPALPSTPNASSRGLRRVARRWGDLVKSRLLSRPRPPKPATTERFWGIVSVEPLVLYHLGIDTSVFEALHAALDRALGHRDAWILRAPDWAEEAPKYGRRWARHARMMEERWPRHRYVFLCATEEATGYFRHAGARALFSPHNALLDERIFRVDADAEKTLDAVYTAQMTGWKRIELAERVERLAIATYNLHLEPGLLESLWDRFDASAWVNFTDREWRRLSAEEMHALYASARCGLMLSDCEGGNYASCEYFLSGLPLVTTPSIGGRHVFYDDRFVRTVAPAADEVAAAVRAFVDAPPDPEVVRGATIERMERFRGTFRGLLDGIADEAGERTTGREIWDRGFHHKYCRWRSVDDVVREIERRLAEA